VTVLDQKSKANLFRQFHHSAKILVLPNAWDVASARVLEDAGMPAIATTSAGIAFSLGYPDGEVISREEMLARVARIANAVHVPVTADLEAGYGPRPEDAARTAQALIDAGAVGLNLEDGTTDPSRPLADESLIVEKIQAIRQVAAKSEVLLVVNARTDVYLAEVGPPESRYENALRRSLAYRDAGADCIFLPGVKEKSLIEKFVAELKCPINILSGPGSPSLPQLEQLGVARVSLGSKPMLAGLGLLRRLVRELNETGTYRALEEMVTYDEMNGLLEKAAS
jgi:2-methylisocitrate lyase-like PEP mutase family enzyme